MPPCISEDRLVFCGKSEVSRQLVYLALAAKDNRLVGAHSRTAVLTNSVKHGLQVESRAADHLQHVAGRGLVF